MSALDTLVATTLADPLAAARAHAAAGGRVVGYYTCNVPIELILAANAFPLHLPHRLDGVTPRADRFMEPLFDRALRSAFDRWLAGDLAFLETIVLPRSQDSAQRVYYYMDELIRTGEVAGPRPLLFDLLKVPRATSENYTVASAIQLAGEVGVVTAQLGYAIERMNSRRQLLARLAARMTEGSVPGDGFAARVLTAGLYAAPAAYDQALEEWLALPPGPAHAGPRIALLGSAPPDDRLQRAINSAGGVVVAEHHLLGPERHGPVIAEGELAIDSLARSYHRSVATVRDFGAPLEAVLMRTERLDGVVLWLTEEDDALAWQVPGVAAAAGRRSVPLLALTRQDWLSDVAALAAVREFVTGRSTR